MTIAFKLGDRVAWSNYAKSTEALWESLLKEYGSGPFSVFEIESVPEKEQRWVGHSQWIKICANGRKLSGALLKKV